MYGVEKALFVECACLKPHSLAQARRVVTLLPIWEHTQVCIAIQQTLALMLKDATITTVCNEAGLLTDHADCPWASHPSISTSSLRLKNAASSKSSTTSVPPVIPMSIIFSWPKLSGRFSLVFGWAKGLEYEDVGGELNMPHVGFAMATRVLRFGIRVCENG